MSGIIEASSRQFVRAAQVAASVCERRATVPILRHLHVHANGALQVTGTDLDTSVSASIEYCGAAPPAPFLLRDAAQTLAAIRHAGGVVVALSPDTDGVVINAGELVLQQHRELGASVDDWPSDSPIARRDFRCTLGQRELALMRRVAMAISTEETRYYLNGLFVQMLDDWTLRMVATDGHRMTIADTKVPDREGGMEATHRHGPGHGVIIPRRMINLLLTQLGKAESIELCIGSALPPNRDADLAPDRPHATRIELSGALPDMKVVMRGKVIDGTYPDVGRVVPTSWNGRMVVNVAAMRRAINAIASMADSKITPAIRLDITEGSVTLSGAYASAKAMARIRCEADSALRHLTIGFNGRYLIDALAALPGESAAFDLGDSNAPVLIRDVSESDIFTVLMPMRV